MNKIKNLTWNIFVWLFCISLISWWHYWVFLRPHCYFTRVLFFSILKFLFYVLSLKWHINFEGYVKNNLSVKITSVFNKFNTKLLIFAEVNRGMWFCTSKSMCWNHSMGGFQILFVVTNILDSKLVFGVFRNSFVTSKICLICPTGLDPWKKA